MEAYYQTLRAGWLAGDRDREQALYLLFLTWWHWAEAGNNGLSDDPAAHEIWQQVFDHFGGENSTDPEFLFVAGIELTVTPEEFGDYDTYVSIGERMQERSRDLRPNGLLPEDFIGKGKYGEYFAYMAT